MEQQNIGELIPISESNGKRAVNARMLHAFLGSKQQFQDWIKNRINKYGFIENQDFVSFHKIMKRETGATRVTEYAISVEMAKELSMVENNEKGKIARRYFIRCEQVAKEKAKATNSLSSRVVNARISWVRGVSKLLRLNENSTLTLLKKVGDPLGLPTPNYTSSKGQVLSASELLKRNGMNISSRKFNKLAESKGYITYLTRPGINGKTHCFPSITSKGNAYGENQVSPQNPQQTQPLWYADKFPDLLTILTNGQNEEYDGKQQNTIFKQSKSQN